MIIARLARAHADCIQSGVRPWSLWHLRLPQLRQLDTISKNSLTSPGPLTNFMHRCMGGGETPKWGSLPQGREVDVGTESNEMPRQGDMSVIYDLGCQRLRRRNN